MWNASFSGTDKNDAPPFELELLPILRGMLQRSFPASWDVAINVADESWPDAWLSIAAPDGNKVQLAVETKRRINPKDVLNLLDRYQRRHSTNSLLVMVPFIGLQTQEKLRTAGVSFADATGNLRLELPAPAVLIVLTGASHDPWRESRPLYSLKGATAGRVVRALCDFQPPYGILELGERAKASAATVSRVVALLDQEDLVQREGRGTVIDVTWAALLRRWTQDYAFTRSNRVRSYLEPRGIDALLRKMTTIDSRYAVTGSLAAARIAPIAPPRLATIYVDDIAAMANSLKLRATDSGANVLLTQPYDAVVYDRTEKHDGITYAAPSQVVADLLTGPGRSPAEGDELLRWMEEHQDVWRY